MACDELGRGPSIENDAAVVRQDASELLCGDLRRLLIGLANRRLKDAVSLRDSGA
jgi:hypothetical protein